MNLVIVESPAKCSKIQGYLGPGFKVIATMGHIRALEESLDNVEAAPEFIEPPPGKYILTVKSAKINTKDKLDEESGEDWRSVLQGT